MNRITPAIAIWVLLSFSLFAQQHPTSQSFHPHRPSCAFDEMNFINGQYNPDLAKEIEFYLRKVVPQLSATENRELQNVLLNIPVVVHIIHGGEAIGQGRNISSAQVMSQMNVLNKDFAALNSQFDKTPPKWTTVLGGANIQFCLAAKDPAGNATTGIMRYNMEVTGTSWSNNNINSTIKPAIRWDPTKYLNIYVGAIPGTTAAGGVVGYSNYPTVSQVGTDQDGCVIDYRWFGGPGFAVSGWATVTHEVGHYLGLPHPFQGNSCTSDDGISDTPNIAKATRDLITLDCENGYPTGPVSCGNEHMYVNFMDYVSENCYTSFTKGQINLMRSVLDGTSSGYNYGSRASLLNSAPTQCNLLTYDAGLTKILSPDKITCTSGTISPVVTLRNFGNVNLSSVLIIRKLNETPLDTFRWTGTLIPGANTDVTLRPFTPPNGINKLTLYTSAPNGFADQNTSNDTLSTQITTYIKKATPLIEDFEGETAFPTTDGIFSLNITGDAYVWEYSNNVSSFGKGSKSVSFNNSAGPVENSPYGTIDALITPYLDLRGKTNTTLMFDVAYAPDSFGFIDSLFVLSANNCSAFFSKSHYRKGGKSLGTAPSTLQTFVPKPDQWRTEMIDLSEYDGDSALAIALVNASGWGARVYVDNIRVGRACSTLKANLTAVATGCGTCIGEASANVTGGNGAYQYAWSAAGSGQGTATAKQLCAGTVTVTVTDAFGCTVTSSTTITGKPKPGGTLTLTHETSNGAKNGTATVLGSGGTPPYIFNWSTGATGSSISGLSPGNYSVKITDQNVCDTTLNFTINAFTCSPFSIGSTVNHVSCKGGANGSLTANPSGTTGPFTYAWSNGLNGQSISGLIAGTYTVTVTNGSNCTSTASFTINEPPVLNLTVGSTHETAFNAKNGTATASASGGTPNYSYSWSNGASGSFISNLPPGMYTVTATDASGCTKTGAVTVNSFNCGTFTSSISSTNIACFGTNTGIASAIASGGQTPYSYNWNNGLKTQQISNLAAGTYQVTVSDMTGCSSTHSVTISQASQLLLSLSSTSTTGPGKADGTASASASGGTPNYTYLWSNGSKTANITGLSPGNYTVTVTDAAGCTITKAVSVSGTNCTLGIMMASTNTSCTLNPEGSAEVTQVSGANGNITYKWSTGSNLFYITKLVAGMYSVTVTDAAGCDQVGSVEVKSTDNIAPRLVLRSMDIFVDSTGKATVNPTALAEGTTDNCGVVNYTATPSTFDCSSLGIRNVTVKATDGAGNNTSGVVNVRVIDNVKPKINCPPNYSQAACQNVTYPLPTATDNCGTPTISLAGGQLSGSKFQTGTTRVTWKAVDFAGNESSCFFDVTVGASLKVQLTSITHATSGQANGKIIFSISGGTSPYSLTWLRNGNPLPEFDPMKAQAGNYQIVVSDAGGCTEFSQQFTVENLTGTFENDSNYSLSMYPNPVNDVLQIHFDFPAAEQLIFTIFDLHGRLLSKTKSGVASGTVALTEFESMKPGVYWLKIEAGNKILMKKVLKL